MLPSNLTGVPNKVSGECIHVHLKTIKYHGKGLYFFEILLKKLTFLYYRFIAHKLKYFKSFFFFNSDVYDLQLRKIKNSVSQKKIYKTEMFKIQTRFNYALNTWLGLLLHELLLQCGVAWKRSTCGTAEALLNPRLL